MTITLKHIYNTNQTFAIDSYITIGDNVYFTSNGKTYQADKNDMV
jgi:hypothetical protein